MKAFAVSAAVAILAAFAQAAPAPNPAQVQARVFDAPVIFYGAGGAYYTESIPADGSQVIIDNPLSVSSINSPSAANCIFFGKDGSSTFVIGGQTATVAPPQQIVRGSCDI
ncbi:hypothetical protein MMC07_008162 [Pseudocyphellaria aurata]|nr:hypothetical protein [Pseudocyphellaria aurata]